MLAQRVRNSSATELLVHYMMMIASHLDYIRSRDGIVEKTICDDAATELSFVLDDINALRVDHQVSGVRDAVGDVCYLVVDLLAKAQEREAIMETFEAVKDAALQEEGADRIKVKYARAVDIQHAIDYFYRARALLAEPAQEFGIDIEVLDSPSGIVL
ncbi:MAG: hypothetical protein FWD41_00965 [Actinomycetia bacterium]|nr:hypothetical protein [Actinomycetes bacterium]